MQGKPNRGNAAAAAIASLLVAGCVGNGKGRGCLSELAKSNGSGASRDIVGE